MASAGSKAASGAASGAAAGASFGPWGALAGGVIGGAAGYLQGDDPKAPVPVLPPPPQLAGGYSSALGGAYIDPVTKRIVYTDNSTNAEGAATGYQNAIMRQLLLGGNGAQLGIEDQIAATKQLIDRLKNPEKSGGGAPKPSDFIEKAWLDDKGEPIDINSYDFGKGMQSNSPLFQRFMANTHGGDYGKGSLEQKFQRWASDAYERSVKASYQEYENAKKTATGNSATSGEALDAAMRKLDYLTKIQASGAQTEGEFAQNPLMNFLNRRNTKPGDPDYMTKFADPNTKIMDDTFKKYLGLADVDTDSSALKIAGGIDPGMPDAKGANARLQAEFDASKGGLGGERMGPIGEYDNSALGDFIRNQDRIAEKDYASRDALDVANMARRGIIGGSSDIARLGTRQALEDTLSANRAQMYSLDKADRATHFDQKFRVDQHNSDVAKSGALARLQGMLQVGSQTFGNELAAKDLFDKLQNQVWANNQSEKQRNFANAMTALTQHTGLDQRTIDNARTEEGLDRMNFADRMALLSYLSGQDQQTYNQSRGDMQLGLNQAGLAFNVGNTAVGNQSNWQGANAAAQNAYNMGQWQGQIADNARTQGAVNDALGALGSVDWSSWGGGSDGGADEFGDWMSQMQTAPTSPSTQTTTSNADLRARAANGSLFPQTPAAPPAPKSNSLFDMSQYYTPGVKRPMGSVR